VGWCAAAAGGGAAIRSEAQGERKGWAKNPKTERSGLVWGLPCQTAVENDRGRWWGDVDKVVVVVCMRVRARTREEGARAKKTLKTRKPSHYGSGLGGSRMQVGK
jgi:hypothetical protein